MRVEHSLAVLLALYGAVLPSTATAQEVQPVCTGLPSAEAEIACLRARLGEGPRAVEEPDRQGQHPAPGDRNTARGTMGIEQVVRAAPTAPVAVAARRDRAQPETLAATIIDSRRGLHGRLLMQLDNGQVWQQIEDIGSPIRIEQGERRAVAISRSGFGGYRMEFTDNGRRMAVERLR